MKPSRTQYKVLLVGGGLSGGGGEIHCNMLAKFLYGGSADVLLVTRPGVQCNRNATIPIRENAKVTILKVFWSCLRNDYDIIYGFGRFASFIATCLQQCLSPRSALVLMDISVFLRAHRSDARWWRALPYFGCQVAYGRANLLLANSESSVAGLKILTGDSVPVARVPNLIDLERVSDLCSAVAGQQAISGAYILTMGRLLASKRIDAAILGFAEIAPRCSHKLLIVGSGPDQQRLEEIARRCQVADRVAFLGWVSNPLPLLAKADALMHLSTIEGFPNAILEAMILKVPVVSGDWGDDARRLAESRALLVVDSDNAFAVGQATLQALFDSKIRTTLIENASIEATEHTIPYAIHCYESLLNQAVRVPSASLRATSAGREAHSDINNRLLQRLQ